MPIVLLIVLVVLLLLGLSRCGNDDSSDDASSTSTPTTTAAPSATATASAAATSDAAGTTPGSASSTGGLTLGTTALFSDGDSSTATADLTQYAGQPAVGTAVIVESVPADEGFWVGSSDTERVWVQLTGQGESPFKVKAGQTVSFIGTVTGHGADFPAKVGVTAAEGADQLVAQKQHVQVERSALTIA
ncbi:hypothetical protein [Cryptosporangium sp. NPDC048952]|uniref:hypothetical protein n=1 Tax=Cryptosporangium sp. NPDC048952 TaxID=3363961 RepID=UPI0037249731